MGKALPKQGTKFYNVATYFNMAQRSLIRGETPVILVSGDDDRDMVMVQVYPTTDAYDKGEAFKRMMVFDVPASKVHSWVADNHVDYLGTTAHVHYRDM